MNGQTHRSMIGSWQEKVGGPFASRPSFRSAQLVARPFGRFLRLLHLFAHLSFDCIKIEARAPLHRRIIKESLDFLANYLLDEHEAPELVLEPIEVLLRAILRPIAWPARALERIEAQVGDVWHVRVGFFAQPASRLVDEAELIVVNAHGADRAFTEIENLVTRGRPFSGYGGHLVVAIQMVLVSHVADLFAL